MHRHRAAAAVLAVMAGLLLGTCGATPPPEGAPGHHTGDGFRNLPGSTLARGNFFDWTGFFFRRLGESFGAPPEMPADHVLEPAAARAGFDALDGADGVTWLGHAAFLLRLDGITVLTDPFLSERASPFSAWGPARYAGPGMAVADLPAIDVVLVSHNHYDHLDEATIEALPGKERIEVIVPLGLGEFFRERGYVRVHELDWRDQVSVDGLTITALPTVHFSARGLFDRNEALWAGYALRSGRHHLFFAGDTGYGTVFGDVVAAYGPFDFGLIPIGAYDPRTIMSAVHVTPEEALKIAGDIGVGTFVAHHWGTVRLTEEPVLDPPRRFLAAGRRAGYADGDLWLLKIGETRALGR